MDQDRISDFGVIKGKISEFYGSFMSSITGDPYNMVGLYYTTNSECNIRLYRVFDGTAINYFEGIDIERLKTHPLVQSFKVCPFDISGWEIDGNIEDIKTRFQKGLYRVILLDPSLFSTGGYANFILSGLGITKNPVMNGYHKINEVILATTNIDPQLNRGEIHHDIVESRYLEKCFEYFNNDAINIYSSSHNNIFTHTHFNMLKESRELFEKTANAFISLALSSAPFREYFRNLIMKPTVGKDVGKKEDMEKEGLTMDYFLNKVDRGDIDETSRIKLVRSLSHYLLPAAQEHEKKNVDNEMEFIRDIINSMLEGFTTDKIPLISLPELVTSYNSIANKLGLSQVNLGNNPNNHRSIGALLTTSTKSFSPDDVEMKLKSGEIIFIPTKCSSFDDFTDDELIQILRYIKSLRSFDGRFNHLTDKLVETLAIRARLNTGSIT